jgi:hypothetical protein
MFDLGTDRVFRVLASILVAVSRIGVVVASFMAAYVNLTLTSPMVLAYPVRVRMRTEKVTASACRPCA